MHPASHFVSCISLLLISCLSGTVYGQCSSTSTPAPTAANCSGTPLPNGNPTIGPGTTYYSSGNNNNQNFTLNGGTLYICSGTLSTSNNSALTYGTIVVGSGATFRYNGNDVTSTTGPLTITNYGTLSLNANVELSTAGSFIDNASSSAVTDFDIRNLILNTNTQLRVRGSVTLNQLTTTPGSTICQGQLSSLFVKSRFSNTQLNVLQLIPGAANVCLRVPGNNDINTANLTNTPAGVVKICLSGNVTLPNPGTAQPVPNCNGCISALPVTLTSFTAKPQATQVLLNWETAQELNNAGFVVERSRDGKTYTSVSELLPGHGTTAIPQRYQWRDTQPAAGQCYYRLRQSDFDGQRTFSPVVPVILSPEYALVQHSTEAQMLTVTLAPCATATQVRMLDAMGRAHFSQSIAAHAEQLTLRLPLADLSSGMYFLNSYSNGQRQVVRFAR